jgi:hypothetical protein
MTVVLYLFFSANNSADLGGKKRFFKDNEKNISHSQAIL